MEFFKKKAEELAEELIPDSLKEEIQDMALKVAQAAIKKLLESPEVREVKRALLRKVAQEMLEQELEKRLGDSYSILQKTASTILLPIMTHALDKAIDTVLDEFKRHS
ncbi:MAG: hypothetical protein ACFFCZ_10155 [Promethearchaeota archaeon]